MDLGHHVDVISGEPYPDLDSRVGLVKLPGLNLYAHPKPTRALAQRKWMDPINLFEWLSFLSGGFPEPFTFGHRLLRYFKAEQPTTTSFTTIKVCVPGCWDYSAGVMQSPARSIIRLRLTEISPCKTTTTGAWTC